MVGSETADRPYLSGPGRTVARRVCHICSDKATHPIRKKSLPHLILLTLEFHIGQDGLLRHRSLRRRLAPHID